MSATAIAAEIRGTTAALHPPAPATLEDAGLSQHLVSQLLLKMLNFGSDISGVEIARRLGLEFSVVQPVLDFLRLSHQCETFGGALLDAPSYRYRITDAGRRRAMLFLE